MRVFYGDARVSDELWSQVALDRGCWLSTGAVLARNFDPGFRDRLWGVARRLWIELTGDKRDLDAVWSCGREACVNPRHFEVVGEHELVDGQRPLRFCNRDHPFVRENVYTNPDGTYYCRGCMRLAAERRRDGRAEPRKGGWPDGHVVFGPAMQKLAASHGYDVEDRLVAE